MNTEFEKDLKEIYREDTEGKRIKPSIVSKFDNANFSETNEVVEFNMDKPMTYKEFKKLSEQSKREYILHIRKEYKVFEKNIAEDMLGIHQNTFTVKMKQLGIPAGRRGDTVIRKDVYERWQKFLAGNEPETIQNEPTPDTAPIEQPTEQIPENEVVATFNIRGKLNISQIEKMITTCYPDGTDNVFLTLTISKSVMKERDSVVY